MTTTRIYNVRNNDTGKERLVRAAHPARATAYVARNAYTVTVASQDQLVAAFTAEPRIEIEDATSPAPAPEADVDSTAKVRA